MNNNNENNCKETVKSISTIHILEGIDALLLIASCFVLPELIAGLLFGLSANLLIKCILRAKGEK